MKIITKTQSFNFKRGLLLILLMSVNMQGFSQNDFSKLFESTLPSVLKIETFDSDNIPLMSGTGFFIESNGKAVSNLHVFKGAFRSHITTSGGKTYDIDKIWYKNDSLDLVTFTIKKKDNEVFPFLRIATKLSKIGEEVFVIGNPIGLDFSVSNGIISSIRQQSGPGQIIQTNAPISAGSSGSPLMDMNGFVIGVITYTFTQGQNLNFAISLLDKNLSKDFIGLDLSKFSESIKKDNGKFIDDIYANVRGFHYAMCLNWRFNIDFKKSMIGGPEWQVFISKSDKLTPIESYVQGYFGDKTAGTTAVLVVDKNLAYVISFGTDYSISPSAKSSLVLVSRITNGEASHIFNYVVENTRINSTDNRFLENVGNSRISMIIEDQIYVRSIQLDDHIEGIPFSGDTFYIKQYKIN